MCYWKYECDEVKNKEGRKATLKGFAIKTSMSEMIPQGEEGKKTVEVQVFLVEDCREEILVIKDKV